MNAQTRPPLKFTLCFLTRADAVLMLLRSKAPNRGLWNGVGGHIEAGESPYASCLREVHEETGFQMETIRFAGLLTWEGFETPNAGLYIFTGQAPGADLAACNEGVLAWKPRDWVLSSQDVVSNIHVFGPDVFRMAKPEWFHFTYDNGRILRYQRFALPAHATPWLEDGA